MSSQKSIQELIGQIERKDRRFRLAQVLFMLLVVSTLCMVLLVQYRTISEYRIQSAQRQKDIIALEKHNDAQLAKQTRYIQCIAQFYNTKDWASRALTDLDKCTISKDGSIIPGVSFTPAAGSGTVATNGNPAPAGPTQTASMTPTASAPPPDERSNVQKAGDAVMTLTCEIPLIGRLCGL